MEKERKKHITKLESKFDRMEWKWNGIGMKKLREKKFGGICGGNGKEKEWKWNGNFFDKTSGNKF